jgi:bifunctional DNA-binding transcriptional regulator/antitoxin component of YhaV-PrlF toxin-antitoxin module
MNERGQLVIREEVRSTLDLEGGSVLVLAKRGDEIVLRRESDVLEELYTFWSGVKTRALERAWDEEDEVWDEHYCGARS